MPIINNLDEAKNLAIQIVTDIALYNPIKVKQGVENDTLFDLLREEIDEGRAFYLGKISEKLAGETNFFNWALADILIKPNAGLKSKIW